jgi:peptidyl-prolyl cis-trans isomerase B (cyclophilin B)
MLSNIIGIILFIIFIIIVKYVLTFTPKFKKNKKKVKFKKNKEKKNNIKLMNNITNNIINIKEKTDKVYLEIEENGKIIGKIIINLFDKVVPKTAKNFRELCRSKKYITAPFHRIIKDFMIQGGDFTNYDGTGGHSIYGNKFDDENFKLNHNKKYLLSMANSGVNTNGSQFFITTSVCPHLDGKHVVFGEVIDGFDLVDYLNETKTNNDDKPRNMIIISDCGVL